MFSGICLEIRRGWASDSRAITSRTEDRGSTDTLPASYEIKSPQVKAAHAAAIIIIEDTHRLTRQKTQAGRWSASDAFWDGDHRHNTPHHVRQLVWGMKTRMQSPRNTTRKKWSVLRATDHAAKNNKNHRQDQAGYRSALCRSCGPVFTCEALRVWKYPEPHTNQSDVACLCRLHRCGSTGKKTRERGRGGRKRHERSVD